MCNLLREKVLQLFVTTQVQAVVKEVRLIPNLTTEYATAPAPLLFSFSLGSSMATEFIRCDDTETRQMP